MTIEYASEKLLPSYIYELIEGAKDELCEISLEPDEAVSIMDEFKRSLIHWFASHKVDWNV